MDSLTGAVDWIYSIRGAAWRKSLDRMHRLLEVLGIPNGGNRRFIHIAGTNGKGSTVTMVEAMLRGAGYTTGSCVSPYVHSVRERVAVNGESISELDFVRAAQATRSACEQLENEGFGRCTVFEVFTAMAFWTWEEKGVDFGVVEVGLGGKLDCTNVINPVVSAVVSVGWDHMDVLGDSLEEIAAEKAGVFKTGKPGVVGELPAEAMEVMLCRAEEVGSDLQTFGRDWSLSSAGTAKHFELVCQFGSFELPRPWRLPGLIQVHNAAVAAMCFLISTEGLIDRTGQLEAMSYGLKEAFLPGRFEVVRKLGRTWVLDGAHNEQSVSELVRTFRALYPGIAPNIVFGMLNRHDPGPCGSQLKLLGGDVRCVPIAWEASADPHELAKTCGFKRGYDSLAEAVDELDKDVVLVTGSFYLISDVVGFLDRLEYSGQF